MPVPQPRILAAVLAAGQSSRFESTKLTARLQGVPLVRRLATTASEVFGSKVVTVLGHDRELVFEALDSESGFVVVNERYKSGLGSSIAAAARTCRRVADALVVLLADQPFVTAEHLQTLIDTWSGADDEIVASSYAGTQGPPALFPSGAFEALCSLRGDKGAHELFYDERFRLSTVRFEPAAIDIDTPADLAAAKARG